jgi:hypothetical protein
MNDVNRIRAFGFSIGTISSADKSSSDVTSRSLFNLDSKQSAHNPRALTGVVHLLYFVPQVLQMAMIRQGLGEIDNIRRVKNFRAEILDR